MGEGRERRGRRGGKEEGGRRREGGGKKQRIQLYLETNIKCYLNIKYY